jgi:gas vesicle structural protein
MEGGDKMAAIQKSVDSSSLAEVIELLTIDARIVIASVDTWLRYAEAVGLLKHDKHHLGDESGLEAAL